MPRPNEIPPDDARALVAEVGAGELITVGTDGFPTATRLPLLWEGDRVRLHMAIANPHWRTIADDSPALLVVTGAEAYLSPSFYASKREHGRVVPTWNYSAVQLRGRITVHQDAGWLGEQVADLTDLNESERDEPWAVSDAPAEFIAQQLRAIVGIEMVVASFTGKAKLSQNRSDADRAGVVEGLLTTGRSRDAEVAHRMR
ncbi:FMN-binding negative transcriptional regulator [Nocardioides acrostichi]|uniref:FMN-binding negative transcriptional regulator n=1 Tax=Nocardioides acrostichi TaxID=2784339 RepID=UPI002E2AD2BC|nr:FMN-binding negative transcriptional regulator [Nocardioides acrostichi]